jgi:radical SAM enzyme (TIGR01210 family)
MAPRPPRPWGTSTPATKRRSGSASSRTTRSRPLDASAQTSRIRALRSAKARVDPWRPLGILVEEERVCGGALESVATVFLAGSECPFTCVFCDLWRHTLEGPTPEGALPAQLRLALEDDAVRRARPRRIKLYNASNFFDPRAVPPADLPVLAELLRPFDGVTVECHPSLVGDACFEFALRLAGRLEVAMGLETIHPEALARLNKRVRPDDFADAAARLARADIDVRAFVLVGAPFVPAQEGARWAVASTAFAIEQGAGVVALVPVRGGNGELERLAAAGEFSPPTLRDLEAVLEAAWRPAGSVVIADLWDAARLPACRACAAPRIERLARINRTGRLEPSVRCDACLGRERP